MPKIIEVDPDILKRYTSTNLCQIQIQPVRRVRRVAKQTSVNRLRKSKYRAAIKKMEELIKSGEKDKIKTFFPKFSVNFNESSENWHNR